MRVLAIVAAVAAAACSISSSDSLRLVEATPDHGPLVGGTTIDLIGAGFAADGAPPRVLFAGREAPLAAPIDDGTLRVVIPFGDHAGDAEVVVLTERDTVRATGIFHYSTPPSIASLSPRDVLYSAEATRIEVVGKGFLDESAGTPTVVIDGQLALDVDVESDTRLSFVVAAGRPLAEPELVIANQRGTATRPRSFRYLPSFRPGLLLFPGFSILFAIFYDPVDNTAVPIPRIAPATIRNTAVVRDDNGTYWALDRNFRFGRLDLSTQRIEAAIDTAGWFPTMINADRTYYAIDRTLVRAGRLDPLSGVFTPISPALPCCGSFGLAHDGERLWVSTRAVPPATGTALRTLDPETGELGPPLQLTGLSSFLVEEMRFFNGRLFATSRDSRFVEIDPVTGLVTILPISFGRCNAMEVYDPATAARGP